MTIVVLSKWYLKKLATINGTGLLFISLLLLIISSSISQHLLLGTHFLEDRVALFIVPVFIFVLIYFFNELSRVSAFSKIFGSIILSLLCVATVYNFTQASNLSYCYNWQYDSSTKQMLCDLKKESRAAENNKTKLGVVWIYEPTINFYRDTKKLDWLQQVDRSGPGGNFDYYYVNTLDYFKNGGIQVIKEYKTSQSYLVRKLEIGK